MAVNGTGNTARGLTSAIALFFAWAALTGAVRGWVKLKKRDSWGADDNFVLVSMVVIIARVFTVTFAVHHGFGNPWSSLADADMQAVDKLLYASQILYVLTMGLTRISTSQFTARFLARGQTHVRSAQAITVSCGLWTLVSTLAIAIRSNYSTPWNTRDGTEALFIRWICVEVVGLTIDVCAVALSVHFIWDLQMPLEKRISVSAFFVCRLLIAPVIALRLWQLSPTAVKIPDQPRINAYILTEGTLELAFALASITCLKPFVRPFHSGWVRSNAPPSGGGFTTVPKKSQKEEYVELSAARSAAETKNGAVIVMKRSRDLRAPERRLSKSPVLSRPDGVVHAASASFVKAGQMDPDAQGMSISKTQAWTVSYDDNEEERRLVGRR